MRYKDYLERPAWKRRRLWHLRWARGRCQVCGCSGDLEVHHRDYLHLGRERHYDMLAVHRECHQAIHDFLETGGGLVKGWNSAGQKYGEGAARGATGQGSARVAALQEEGAIPRHTKPFITDSEVEYGVW